MSDEQKEKAKKDFEILNNYFQSMFANANNYVQKGKSATEAIILTVSAANYGLINQLLNPEPIKPVEVEADSYIELNPQTLKPIENKDNSSGNAEGV